MAEGIHLIAEKLRPHRGLLAHGEDVQDPAPAGKLTRTLHLLRPGIAGQQQPPDQHFRIIRAVIAQGKGRLRQRLRRHRPQHHGVGAGAEHPALPLLQPVKGVDAPLLIIVGGPLQIVEHQVAAGQRQRLLPGEGLQVQRKAAGRRLIPQQDAEGALRQILQQRRGDMGAMDRRRPIYGNDAARLQLPQELLIFRQLPGQGLDGLHGSSFVGLMHGKRCHAAG